MAAMTPNTRPVDTTTQIIARAFGQFLGTVAVALVAHRIRHRRAAA